MVAAATISAFAALQPQRNQTMPFVVVENCIRCKYTDCVEVCPVDCFHEGPNFLVIDPVECIDCTLCEPERPLQPGEFTWSPGEAKGELVVVADLKTQMVHVYRGGEEIGVSTISTGRKGFETPTDRKSTRLN